MDKKSILAQIKTDPHKLGHLCGFKKLFSLHSQWIHECWDSAGSHGLMAFRGSYKTTAIVIVGIVRYLLFKPNTRILIVRKTHIDACYIIKTVSRLFELQHIQSLFFIVHGFYPKKIIDAQNALLFNFKNTATPEPALRAFGVRDSMTGTHADVIIADDIIGLEDRVSRAEREKIKEHIKEMAANIIDPGALTIWLGTKWAAGDGWDVIDIFTNVKKYPASKYNFLPPGVIEEKKKRLSPFLYSINYELEIINDSCLLFQEPAYAPFPRHLWRGGRVTAQIDAAYGGIDTCALTVMGMQEGSPLIHALGRFLAVECKSKKGNLTAAQKNFLGQVRLSGGVAILAYSVDDLAAVAAREHHVFFPAFPIYNKE